MTAVLYQPMYLFPFLLLLQEMHSDVISHLLADHVSHAGDCSALVTDSAMGRRTVKSETDEDKTVVKYLKSGSARSGKGLGHSRCGFGTLLGLRFCTKAVAMLRSSSHHGHIYFGDFNIHGR